MFQKKELKPSNKENSKGSSYVGNGGRRLMGKRFVMELWSTLEVDWVKVNYIEAYNEKDKVVGIQMVIRN